MKFSTRGTGIPFWLYWDLRNGLYEYDKANFLMLKSLMKKDTVFFDIGAYIGMYSLYVAKSCRDCTIISFEPDPTIMKNLESNILLNGLVNVTPLQCAVGALDGEEYFKASHDSTSRIDKRKKGAIKVSSVRLDTFVRKNGIRPNIVKIDVEGYEYEVLKGGRIALSDPHVWVFREVHSDTLQRRDVMEDFIDELFGLSRLVTKVGCGSMCTRRDLAEGGHFIIHGI